MLLIIEGKQMKKLILKKVSELVAGDVFHAGVSCPCSFEVLEIVDRGHDFNVLLKPDNASFTGWKSYSKKDVMRMSEW